MTHEPEQEHTRGGEPSEPDLPPGEIVTGPGGAEREHAGLRGVWERQPVRARAMIAAATVGVLTVGGTVAYAATSGTSEGAAPAAAASSPSGSAAPDREGHRFGFRGGVHGEETVKDPDSGDWVVRIWQRGTVEKVDGDKVTVKSEDGASWTWTVGDDAKVLGDGKSESGAGAVEKGDTVYVTGRLSGDDDRSATRVFTSAPGTDGLEKGRHGMPGHGPGHWRNDGPSTEGEAS